MNRIVEIAGGAAILMTFAAGNRATWNLL